MLKRFVALALVGLGVVPAAASAHAATTTTTPPTGAIPAPAPTAQPTGLGTDGALDQLASSCFNGSMQACDDLYEATRQDPANAAYRVYGDTCAGRQAEGTGFACARVFLDGPGAGAPVGPTTTAGPTTATTSTTAPPTPAATTTAPIPNIPETEMFGVGAATGSVMAACPVGQHAVPDATGGDWSSCRPNTATPPAQTVLLATDAVCPVQGDLEHPDPDNDDVFTFTDPSQMKTLLECILPEALAWMAWEYGGTLDIPTEWAGTQATSLMPNGFLYVPTGVRVTGNRETCRGEDAQGLYSYSDFDLAYCPVDGYIYLGEAAMWRDYKEHGDADIWGTISHEWGHRIQQLTGGRSSATPNEQIAFENQADCFSGAFLDYSARYTARDAPSTPDDIFDLFIGLFEIGDPRIGLDTQNHGTIDQRLRAFYVGYNSPDNVGAWACDFYVTSESIIPPSRQNATTTTVAS